MKAFFVNKFESRGSDSYLNVIMKQKQSAITAQKYPAYNGIWNALLYKKFFELQLLKHAGLPIRRSTHKYGRFRSGAKKFIESEVLKLPPCRDRDLMLTVLPSLKAPTEIFLRQVIVQDESLEILADYELANFIQILSLMFIDDRLIYDYTTTIPLVPAYTIEDLRGYKYWFSNTNKKDGWGVIEKYRLQSIIKSFPDNSEAYKQLLQLPYNGSNRMQAVLELGIPYRPEDRSRLLSQACDSELSQLRLSQKVNDRKDVNSAVRNIERLTNMMESLGLPYQAAKKDNNESRLGASPVYVPNIGGIGGDGL